MQGIQWTNSPLDQICIQEFATNFYQGWFPCCAIASHTLYRLRGSMQQQDYSSSNRHMQVSVTYNNIFDGKPSMS